MTIPRYLRATTLALASLAIAPTPARPQDRLPEVQRIVFVGDSITHSGGYIASLEAAAIVQEPNRHVEFLNLGLPSETVSGLSEPGHAGGQFPRPDLHERLKRVLDQTQPDLVVACYGMNDGIYYPPGTERFEAFQSGIVRLHQAVIDRGAKLIHLTPAFFDALPNQDKLLPLGLEQYTAPYVGYDEVLEEYSQWLLRQKAAGWVVYDVHGAMKSTVQQRRQTDPTFTFAADGVHPNAAGQAVIAGLLAEAWGLKLDAQGRPIHPRGDQILKLVTQKQNILKLAWLSATGHARPGIPQGLPLEEAHKKAAALDQQARQWLPLP